MNGRAAAFDPAQYERLSTGTVPGYAALQELVAVTAAALAPADAKVLDLGCGTGAGLLALARAMPEARLMGCDPAPPMVAAARARLDEAGVNARLTSGPLSAAAPEGPFDLIVCTLVLHFVPPSERSELLADLRGALRPGGALVISVLERSDAPEVQRAWNQIRRHYAAKRGVTPAELEAREAQTRGKVHPFGPGELADTLDAAGFTASTPLFRSLAVHTRLARAGG